jgi:hypothetical protein
MYHKCLTCDRWLIGYFAIVFPNLMGALSSNHHLEELINTHGRLHRFDLLQTSSFRPLVALLLALLREFTF